MQFKTAFLLGFISTTLLTLVVGTAKRKKPSMSLYMHRSQLLSSLVNSVVRQEDLEGIIQRVLGASVSLVTADAASVTIIHRPHLLEGGKLAGVRYVAVAEGPISKEDVVIVPGEGLVGSSLRAKRPKFSNSVGGDVRCSQIDYLPGHPIAPRSSIAAPIRDESGEPVAVLQVWLTRRSLLTRDTFSDFDVEFVALLCESVAAVIALQYDRVDVCSSSSLDVVEGLFEEATAASDEGAASRFVVRADVNGERIIHSPLVRHKAHWTLHIDRGNFYLTSLHICIRQRLRRALIANGAAPIGCVIRIGDAAYTTVLLTAPDYGVSFPRLAHSSVLVPKSGFNITLVCRPLRQMFQFEQLTNSRLLGPSARAQWKFADHVVEIDRSRVSITAAANLGVSTLAPDVIPSTSTSSSSKTNEGFTSPSEKHRSPPPLTAISNSIITRRGPSPKEEKPAKKMRNIVVRSDSTMRLLDSPDFSLERVASERAFRLDSHGSTILKHLVAFERQGLNWPFEPALWWHRFGRTVLALCLSLRDLFINESRVLQVTSPVFVLGSIAGEYADLYALSHTFWPCGMHVGPCTVVQTGGLIGNDPNHSLEVILFLFSQKLRRSQSVILLRGESETREGSQPLKTSCLARFGYQLGQEVWEAINLCFDVMPLSAVIDESVFCSHSGYPRPSFGGLEGLRQLPHDLPNPRSCPLAWQVIGGPPAHPKLDAMAAFALSSSGFSPTPTTVKSPTFDRTENGSGNGIANGIGNHANGVHKSTGNGSVDHKNGEQQQQEKVIDDCWPSSSPCGEEVQGLFSSFEGEVTPGRKYEDSLEEFLISNNVSHVIKGRMASVKGMKVEYRAQQVSLVSFSTPVSPAATALVHEGKIRFFILSPKDGSRQSSFSESPKFSTSSSPKSFFNTNSNSNSNSSCNKASGGGRNSPSPFLSSLSNENLMQNSTLLQESGRVDEEEECGFSSSSSSSNNEVETIDSDINIVEALENQGRIEERLNN